jgi:hypothetical protein
VRDFPAGHSREAGGSGIGEGAEEIVPVWSSSRSLFMIDTTLPYSGEPVLLGAFGKMSYIVSYRSNIASYRVYSRS